MLKLNTIPKDVFRGFAKEMMELSKSHGGEIDENDPLSPAREHGAHKATGVPREQYSRPQQTRLWDNAPLGAVK